MSNERKGMRHAPLRIENTTKNEKYKQGLPESESVSNLISGLSLSEKLKYGGRAALFSLFLSSLLLFDSFLLPQTSNLSVQALGGDASESFEMVGKGGESISSEIQSAKNLSSEASQASFSKARNVASDASSEEIGNEVVQDGEEGGSDAETTDVTESLPEENTGDNAEDVVAESETVLTQEAADASASTDSSTPAAIVYPVSTPTADPSVGSRFVSTVFIGDSRFEGISAYNIADPSSVYAIIGASSNQADLQSKVIQAAQVQPARAVFNLGFNDTATFAMNPDAFIQSYRALIQQFRSISPNTAIYVAAILPANAGGVSSFPYASAVPAFNEAICRMCAEEGEGWIPITGDYYAGYYSSDGIHFQKPFYYLWLSDIAAQMGM